ncbi:MAG: XdhC family protein [Gemmatimonadetes bacterium]|nr:XdhC family protein [Gemmatimonadota bacterium]
MHGLTAVEAARAALEALAGGPAVAVVTLIAAPPGHTEPAGRRLLLDESGGVRGSLGDRELDEQVLGLARAVLAGAGAGTRELEVGGRPFTIYLEAVRAPEELVLVGAGHNAVPLARLGVLLGFRVTVLDDRDQFAVAERFPDDATVVRADFADPFRAIPIGPRSYVALVTRGHKWDFDCLRRLLEADPLPRYLGMIGSRRRVKAAFQALLEAGVARDRLASVHAPIGLEIGAETPEEVAVSIAAELIRVRRQADGGATPSRARAGSGSDVGALRERERVLDRLLPERPR